MTRSPDIAAGASPPEGGWRRKVANVVVWVVFALGALGGLSGDRD